MTAVALERLDVEEMVGIDNSPAMLEATPTTVRPSRSRRRLAVSRKASLSSTSRHRSDMRSDCP